MKTIVAMFTIVGLFGVAAAAAPMISVDHSVYAVTVQSGSLVTHSFLLTNTGDETLTLSNVRTSCGCTTAALAKRDLPPGESVSVEATVNTKGFHGTVTRTITVSSNDPVTPSITLRIDTTIADVAPAPPEIAVADLKAVYFMLIDVRTATEYATGHLFGAVNIPLAEIQANLTSWVSALPREAPIVVYGATSADGLDAGVLLIGEGLPNVVVLTGGITDWVQQFGERALFAP
jgi:rhodanese-related sulfurtransferase